MRCPSNPEIRISWMAGSVTFSRNPCDMMSSNWTFKVTSNGSVVTGMSGLSESRDISRVVRDVASEMVKSAMPLPLTRSL